MSDLNLEARELRPFFDGRVLCFELTPLQAGMTA
jgi:hypothetical protein